MGILSVSVEDDEKENRDKNEGIQSNNNEKNAKDKEKDKEKSKGNGRVTGRTHCGLSKDTRLSILAASSKLLALKEKLIVSSASSQPGGPSQGEDLNTVVLTLLSVRSPPVTVSYTQARAVCGLFVSRCVLSTVAEAPSLGEGVQRRALTLFLLGRGTHPDSKEELIFQDLTGFCYSCAMWAVLQSLAAAKIIAEYQISLTELRAVRALFCVYDEGCNGRIHAANLLALLKVPALILPSIHCSKDLLCAVSFAFRLSRMPQLLPLIR